MVGNYYALFRSIVKELQKQNKTVAITASTGMAAQNFKGATTIHQWSGIRDNRFQKEKLLTCIEEETKKRIREADVLVIDEIGMVSACVFEKLEFVTRNVRQSLFVFGGLQVFNLYMFTIYTNI